jgi:hypothetical protein
MSVSRDHYGRVRLTVSPIIGVSAPINRPVALRSLTICRMTALGEHAFAVLGLHRVLRLQHGDDSGFHGE